ncbi:site-specific integrase [Pseudomonas sp. MOB-449]|nr:site-specific integrase [Pseudomonas sp. MOB-449]
MKVIDRPLLDFPSLPYGTHEAQYDLASLLFRGASALPADHVMRAIEDNAFGDPDLTRLPLAKALHDALCAQISRGIQPTTIKNRIYCLRVFYSWCDANNQQMTIDNAPNTFRCWVEHLLHRVRIRKDLRNSTAYGTARIVDALLKACLGLRLGLLHTTRLSAEKGKRKALGTEADKQNLDEIFKFGRFLLDVVNSLSVSAITAPLPIIIYLRGGQVLTELCGLRGIDYEQSRSKDAGVKQDFINRRAAIDLDEVFSKRHSLANLRIECELLIFIAQTGMNLAQAANLKKGKFRYKSHGEEVLVYRVYKGRRGGQAEFSIFKEYLSVFKAYLEWLEKLSDPDDERLFPFCYPFKVPTAGGSPRFQGVGDRCAKLNIKAFRPQALRKTRVNWLLRKSRSPDLVAEMAQHSKQVLLSVYEQPHHQSAAVEITKFHRSMEPAISAVGPGLCIAPKHPMSSDSLLISQNTPDCSTPAGCLFCDFQRDIDTEDYVWSLCTYKHLKMLELDRYVPPRGRKLTHPAQAVVEKLRLKLKKISESSEHRSAWLEEAENRIREGRFHPNYDGLIQLAELSQ